MLLCKDETPNDAAKIIKDSLSSRNLTIVAFFNYCMYKCCIVLYCYRNDVSEHKDVKIKTNNFTWTEELPLHLLLLKIDFSFHNFYVTVFMVYWKELCCESCTLF